MGLREILVIGDSRNHLTMSNSIVISELEHIASFRNEVK